MRALADGLLSSGFTDGYNELGRDGLAGTADDSPAARLASFDATGSELITPRQGSVVVMRLGGSSTESIVPLLPLIGSGLRQHLAVYSLGLHNSLPAAEQSQLRRFTTANCGLPRQ